MKNNFINLSFYKPFFKDFTNIYFTPDMTIIYYDNSHLNYIYKERVDNIIYTFNGYYKDEFLIIIINSYDENLKVNIDHKHVIILKVPWLLNKNRFEIDIHEFNKFKTKCYVLPIRNKLLDDININDYIKIYDYKCIELDMRYTVDCSKRYKIFNNIFFGYMTIF